MADVVQQEDPYDLTVWQGKNFEFEVLFTEDDETTPIPLDGYTARGQVRAYPRGPLLVEFTTEVEAPAGRVLVSLTGAQTRKVKDRSVYDLQVESGSTVVGLLHGKVSVIAGVTT